MTKFEIAHAYFMKHVNTDQYRNTSDSDLVMYAWKYADAMQAKADERKPTGAPEAIREAHKRIKDKIDFGEPVKIPREYKRCKQVEVSEWQPDWSQAPSGALSYHIEMDELDGSFQPFWTDSMETHFDGEMFVGYKCAWNAPSFNYQGNWQDSLRKRPQ